MPICSVVVREDKKLLTVLFPDGRDGRAFTLKVLSMLIIHSFQFYIDIHYMLFFVVLPFSLLDQLIILFCDPQYIILWFIVALGRDNGGFI